MIVLSCTSQRSGSHIVLRLVGGQQRSPAEKCCTAALLPAPQPLTTALPCPGRCSAPQFHRHPHPRIFTSLPARDLGSLPFVEQIKVLRTADLEQSGSLPLSRFSLVTLASSVVLACLVEQGRRGSAPPGRWHCLWCLVVGALSEMVKVKDGCVPGVFPVLIAVPCVPGVFTFS